MINVAAVSLGLDGSTEVPEHLKSEVLTFEVVDGVCLKVTSKNCSITIDPRLSINKPDIAVGYDGLEGVVELVWDSEMFNSRDTASSIADRKAINSLYRSLFFVAFEGENIHIITRRPVLSIPQGVTYTALETNDLNFSRPRQWLSSQDSSLLALVVRNKAKRSMMAKIKPLDSIAALEKQVDLLSELVISLASGLDLSKRPAWLDEFTAGLELESANKIIGSQAAATQVIAYKAAMRKLQATYVLQRSETA